MTATTRLLTWGKTGTHGYIRRGAAGRRWLV